MKKILLFILILLSVPAISNANHWNHIYTGYGGMFDYSTEDLTLAGTYYDMFFCSDSRTRNIGTALTINPNLIIMAYDPASISGNTLYRYFDVSPYVKISSLETFKTWCDANERDWEDAFLHYRTDNTFTEDYPSGITTSVLVSGFPVGTIPGWIEGSSPTTGSTATNRMNSRFWSFYGTPREKIWTISGSSGAVRSGNVVTITTTEAHNFYGGESVIIGSVDDASFNGRFNVSAIPTTTTFQYVQIESNATSQNGSVTFNFGRGNWLNHGSTVLTDWLNTRWGYYLTDPGGYKVNGPRWDGYQAQYYYKNRYALAKSQEYFDSGYGTLAEWCTATHISWLDATREALATFLSGTGRTPYIAVNADLVEMTADDGFVDMYKVVGGGADIIWIEKAFQPLFNTPSLVVEKHKIIFKLMEDYNKIVSGWFNGDAVLWSGLLTWTNYSGYIYYTDFFNSKISPYCILVGNYEAGNGAYANHPERIVSSLEAMYAGTIYFDTSTSRLYVWFTGDANPTGQQILLYGGEQLKHAGLAFYYIFYRYQDRGYFWPWFGGGQAIWLQKPHTPAVWFDSITYDVGQPTTAGYGWNGSAWVQNGNDLWENSRMSSSRPYEFWRGNSTTGVAGVWTSDESTVLNSNHRIYARKLDNGYAIYRYRNSYRHDAVEGNLTNPVTFTMPFTFRKLRGDGSLDPPTTQVTIRQSEGVVLITNFGQTPSQYGISVGGVTFR